MKINKPYTLFLTVPYLVCIFEEVCNDLNIPVSIIVNGDFEAEVNVPSVSDLLFKIQPLLASRYNDKTIDINPFRLAHWIDMMSQTTLFFYGRDNQNQEKVVYDGNFFWLRDNDDDDATHINEYVHGEIVYPR